MSNLLIYKASAGSGKTYTLTQEYIKLLNANADNYKHTLAVTFTNKATAEMKSRILDQLYKNSINPLAKQAEYRKMLDDILNDYSNFNIYTIDGFFQSVLRAFALELNLDANFRLELNDAWIIEQAVTNLLAEKDNAELQDWLLEEAKAKARDGEHWLPRTALMKAGEYLGKEAVKRLSGEEFEQLNDFSTIKKLRTELIEIRNSFKQELVAKCKAIVELLRTNGYDWTHNPELFDGKSRSPLKILYSISSNLLKEKDLSVSIFSSIEGYLINDKKSFLKSQSSRKSDPVPDESFLTVPLQTLIEWYHNDISRFVTARSVAKMLNFLGVITSLKRHYETVCSNEAVFPISDTQAFIEKIIDKNDAPFIYEKVGSFYSNFMIDEFQDTSLLQWDNLKPLLSNSLASGNYDLLVGDVKQAIYRWRNSNWALLHKQVYRDFMNQTNVHTLEQNFRSDINVIRFNNTIFPLMAELLANNLEDEELATTIKDIYSDTKQGNGNSDKKGEGFVEVSFITAEKRGNGSKNNTSETEIEPEAVDDDEASVANAPEMSFEGQALLKLTTTIHRLVAGGVICYRDICVLVRGAEQGKKISKTLLLNNIPLLNTQSLVLGKSQMVNYIISAIQLSVNKNDALLRYQVNYHYTTLHGTMFVELLEQILLYAQRPLFEMIEAVVALCDKAVQKEHSLYIQSFIDALTAYYSHFIPTAGEFLEWWQLKGSQLSITVPQDMDAVQLMTIHSSKGLQFKVVMIPFFNTPFKSSNNREVIWVKPKELPFSVLPLIPVYDEAALANSLFKSDYLEEKMNNYVDNLNLIYVAFTRAEKALYVFTEKNGGTTSKGDVTNWSHLINGVRGVHGVDNELSLSLSNYYIESDDCLRVGVEDEFALNRGHENKVSDEIFARDTLVLNGFEAYGYEDRLQIKLEEESYFSLTERDTKRKRGTQMHKVFENIFYHSDIAKGIDLAIREGVILESERLSLYNDISELLSLDPVKSWFDPKNSIKTEASIWADKSYRPDRIIITPEKKAIVVDYKFGGQHNPIYEKQLKNYKTLLNKMGYQQVEGYLWYVISNEIIEV